MMGRRRVGLGRLCVCSVRQSDVRSDAGGDGRRLVGLVVAVCRCQHQNIGSDKRKRIAADEQRARTTCVVVIISRT